MIGDQHSTSYHYVVANNYLVNTPNMAVAINKDIVANRKARMILLTCIAVNTFNF